MAICAVENATIQSPGHGVHQPARILRRCFPAEDGKHLFLQVSAPDQNQYKDRHWDASA